jgi:hypothetical protein
MEEPLIILAPKPYVISTDEVLNRQGLKWAKRSVDGSMSALRRALRLLRSVPSLRSRDQAIANLFPVFGVARQIFGEKLFLVEHGAKSARAASQARPTSHDPSTIDMPASTTSAPAYIGCRTLPYTPLETTLWSSAISMVADEKLL